MISLDASLVIQVINFIFLIFLLNIVLYKPIRNVLLQRKEKISGLEQGVETLNDGAQEKDEAFREGIKKARAKGLKHKETILQEASEDEKQIIGKITEQAQSDLAGVKEQIAKDAEEVRKTLLDQIDEFANTIGHKILGRTVS